MKTVKILGYVMTYEALILRLAIDDEVIEKRLNQEDACFIGNDIFFAMWKGEDEGGPSIRSITRTYDKNEQPIRSWTPRYDPSLGYDVHDDNDIEYESRT